MTVHEVSRLTGVSIRTLHYYDKIGLLHPAQVTEAGYRLYGDAQLERLQQILLFRELEFPLKEIRAILDSTDFDRIKALEQQIVLLKMRKEQLERLIDLACEIKTTGVRKLDFSVFDTTKIEEYEQQAKAVWGKTEAYQEFEKRNGHKTSEDMQGMFEGLMGIFAEFGEMLGHKPEEKMVQEQVERLQRYITGHFYNCTKDILKGLGEMYSAGGSMTENIDHAGGEGTAVFVTEAIRIFCK